MDRPALVPELYVSDLDSSLKFYVELLGFEIAYDRPEERFACLRRGAAYLMLEEAPALHRASEDEFQSGQWRTADLERPFGRGINLEIRVTEIHETYSRLQAAGHGILLPPHERTYRVHGKPYVVCQLLVPDPDGYLIRLSRPIATGTMSVLRSSS